MKVKPRKRKKEITRVYKQKIYTKESESWFTTTKFSHHEKKV